jgi:hypothetical protein
MKISQQQTLEEKTGMKLWDKTMVLKTGRERRSEKPFGCRERIAKRFD